jgi:hypothetical protein
VMRAASCWYNRYNVAFLNEPFVEKFECLGMIQDKSTGVDVYL